MGIGESHAAFAARSGSLHRAALQKRGEWKILTLGTNLNGSGKKFGAPRTLWSWWEL